MLLHACSAFALAPPPRAAAAAAPSSASPRRSGAARASPMPARSARAAAPGTLRVLHAAPRPPMATGEEGAGADVGVAEATQVRPLLPPSSHHPVITELVQLSIRPLECEKNTRLTLQVRMRVHVARMVVTRCAQWIEIE